MIKLFFAVDEKNSTPPLRAVAIPPITRLIINNGGWIRLIATTPRGIINQVIIHVTISLLFGFNLKPCCCFKKSLIGTNWKLLMLWVEMSLISKISFL